MNTMHRARWGPRHVLISIALLILAAPVSGDFADTCARVWPKVAKIFGAGGIRRLHSYSSGVIVSPEGHILTVWDHVLETDRLRVVLSDGQRFDAKLQLVDSGLDAAVIKIEGEDLPFFDLEKSPEAQPGEWVLGFNNAYRVASGNEKPTVIHGVVSALDELRARKGVFDSAYGGSVYIVDGITNNPGAGGGALTNRKGELLGMIGQVLKNKGTNTWLNFALPARMLAPLVRRALKGESSIPSNPVVSRTENQGTGGAKHGIVLVPDVLRHTPSYVDSVVQGSPAAKIGLAPDDLILFIEDEAVTTCRRFASVMAKRAPGEAVSLLVKRDKEILIFEMTLE